MTTKKRYARRRRLEANRLSQQRSTPWSDSDDNRQSQMKAEQTDGQPSDTDIQDRRPVSDFGERQPTERPVTPAAIPMEAHLAITMHLSCLAQGAKISFSGEGDLTLFLKQMSMAGHPNSGHYISAAS